LRIHVWFAAICEYLKYSNNPIFWEPRSELL
jgi:hypothetical protein